jgi:hypothetical protein
MNLKKFLNILAKYVKKMPGKYVKNVIDNLLIALFVEQVSTDIIK